MNASTFFNSATTVLSFVVLAAAVSPARADTNNFRANVERSIDATMKMPTAESKAGVATVAVRIDADGSVVNASLVGTTGVPAYDREAIRTAKTVSYPAGAARDVVMVLGFGREASAQDRAHGATLAAQFRSDRRQLLATETTAQPNG